MVDLAAERVGLAAPPFGNPARRPLARRAAAASLEPVLVELGGLVTLAVMFDVLGAPSLPVDVWEVNLGTEEVLMVMDFSCCPVVARGLRPASSATSLTENSDGLGSLSMRADCFSWIYPGPAPLATASVA